MPNAPVLKPKRMDMDKMEDVFKSKWFRYAIRIILLYTLSVIFKSFDLSFPHTPDTVLLRGQAFSLLFVGFGLLVWEGATWLSKTVGRKSARKSPPARLLIMCLSLVLYGGVSATVFGLLYAVFDIVLFNKYEAWQSVSELSYDLNFGIFLFYLLILAYSGIVFYYQSWKESQLNAERLMRENIQARYDVLKSQIDPHFFFNSLSVLTNLVYKSPDLSAEYITQLAKSYRYILDKKFENLVSLSTELDFLESYTFLMRIRHQDSLVFEVNVREQSKNTAHLPPATLQMLVENAVKHNRFSVNDPLLIRIDDEGDRLIVRNTLRKRSNITRSTGLGLDNISKRYELIGEKRITVTETEDEFLVEVPLFTTKPF